MGIAYNPTIVTDGLVLCLDGGNTKSYPGSGTAWNDLSNTGNNGTLAGGVGYTASNGGALTFDGTNDNITFANSSTVHFLNRDPFTLESWIYVSTVGVNRYPGILVRENNSAPRGGWLLVFSRAVDLVKVVFERWGSGTGTTCEITERALSNFSDKWHHFVGTYDGTTMNLYWNGEVAATPVSSTQNLTNSTTTVTIGQLHNFSYLSGRIGSSRIYNRGLSVSEVQTNFNATRSRYGV